MDTIGLTKMGFASLLLWLACCASLLQLTVAQNACESTNVNGTTEYQICKGLPEALYNLNILPTVEPANGTCGYSGSPELVCALSVIGGCTLCNASDPSLARPPRDSYDRNDPSNPTWWQSISLYDRNIPLHINLTLSLNHSYELILDINILFQSSRPRSMVLEKSSDFGQTWQPYQYYADDCLAVFNMTSATTVTTPTQVICSQQYSSRFSFTEHVVTFDLESRLRLQRSLNDPQMLAEWNAFLELTDLRLRLLHPATDGLEWFHRPEYLSIYYYYGITNIEMFLVCNCNLHGEFCYQDNGMTVCQCYHNTMGRSCEYCQPLYNNRPWRPGGNGSANECQKCDCNDHADSCTYNESLGHGMCDYCRDYTSGASCEICIDGFYRNVSVPASSLNSCIECICEPLGTVENSTCSQYAMDGKPVGQCTCRSNTEGRACDTCIDQYYGLLLTDRPGTCKECNCDLLGTVNASNVCEKQDGVCPCKPNTDTRTCSQCKDGYYGFPTDENQDCLPCDCDLGGSTSTICNKVSGRCPCRGNITDRRCALTDQGFYFNFLDSNSYDAWEAESECITTSAVPHNLFTGQGYQMCYPGNQVVFRGVIAATSLADALFYRPALRYTYASEFPWQLATLNVAIAQPTPGASSLCPQPAGNSLTSFVLTLPPGMATAWYAPEGQALSMDRRCSYDFTLTLNDRGTGSQEIEIDSLVVMPTASSFSIFTQADVTTQQEYKACLSSMTALTSREVAVNQCRDFMFAVSAESNDGVIDCDCDPVGSLSPTCHMYGGNCECKIGIGGSRCDRCLPGFYDFKADGCTACNCDVIGSHSLACDFITGQCPCKSNVAPYGQLTDEGNTGGRQCRGCLANHYGFSSGGGCLPCNCNLQGSLTLQCLDTGECLCKDTVAGRQCNECTPGTYAFSADGCRPCECNAAGSTGSSCDATDGTCTCKVNALGAKCSQCRPGYFNLQQGNDNGCQSCFCHGHSGTCGSAPSYISATIVVDFTAANTDTSSSNTTPSPSGPSTTQVPTDVAPTALPTLPPFTLHSACVLTGCLYRSSPTIHIQSKDRWSATEPEALTIGQDGLRIVHPLTPPTQGYVYLLAPRLYLGRHLELYGQTLSYTMRLDTGVVQTTSNQFLLLTGGKANMEIYYSLEGFQPSLMETVFQAVFYEANWRVVGSDIAPTMTEFLDVLSDIVSIRIQASFGPGTVSTFSRVAMDTAQYVPNPEDYTDFVTTVEQCSCDLSSNTRGLSCEQCKEGTYRQLTLDTPSDPCMTCQCNGRATACDPVTGICQGCQLGTVGDYCESCAVNVQEPLCDSCIANHYGFGTDLFGGACSVCGCNMTGTGGVTQCDMQTGQCPCIGNYGSMLCDSCQFNFFDYTRGCLACDTCYDSISAEHSKLLLQSSNSTNFLESLTANDTSALLGPFHDRLTSTNNQVLQVVQQTAEVIRETGTLTSTVVSLNSTMQQLLSSLSGAIKTGLETAFISLAGVEGLVGQAKAAILDVELALVQANDGLTRGDIQSTSLALQELNTNLTALQTQLTVLSASVQSRETVLAQEVSQLTTVAQETVMTAEQALVTAQQAQSIHDDTTTNTAALITKANEVTTLGQQTEQVVSEVKQRAQLAKIAGEEDTEARLLSSINQIGSMVQEAIGSSVAKGDQAMALQAEALSRQTSSAQVTANVESSKTQTESLITASNLTLEDVSARYERAQAANQSAAQAVTSSEATFTAAQDTLRISQNFDSQASAAQASADAALLQEPEIQTQSALISSQAMSLRADLTGIGTNAQDGHNDASLAHQIAQGEQESVHPVIQTASQLAQEAISKLPDPGTVAAFISSINNTQLQPAIAQCDAFAPDLQSLETMVTQANADSQLVSDGVQTSTAEIYNALTDLQNVQHLDTSELPDLLSRINQLKVGITEVDFSMMMSALVDAVQEQEVWIESTQAQIRVMQAQIHALESFRVT